MDRCADSGSQLEIDLWILDYLVFMATRDVIRDFKSWDSVRNNVILAGQMVDCKQP